MESVEMEIAMDVDVQASSECMCTLSVLDKSFADNECLFCYGTVKYKSKEKEKLLKLTPNGLETIRNKCVECNYTALLNYINCNSDLNHFTHNTCRTAFLRKGKANLAPSKQLLDVPSKRKLRSEMPTFCWTEMCMLCRESVSPGDDVRKVSTLSLQDTLKRACVSRGFDSWALQVQGLLESCNDLPAVDAVYHKRCHTRFINGRSKIEGQLPSGRPVNYGADVAFNRLCDALETSCVEKVYTLPQLYDEMVAMADSDVEVYDRKHLKAKLEDRYGSNLFVDSEPGRPGVVCFRNFTTHILSDKFYEDRERENADKGEIIMKQAARYIAAELRSMPSNMDEYPNPDDIENSDDIPHLLDLFLSMLIHDDRKKMAIAQVIMQAAKPRSCLMPLPFGLGVQIHRLLGSAQLVKELAKWGFSVSLDEVQRYLQSVMQSSNGWHPEECRNAIFTHFVADNVDHNIRTVDGLETFHGMGIIAISCFGPGVESVARRKIKRIPQRLLAADVCRDRGLPLLPYCSQAGLGLAKLVLKPIECLNLPALDICHTKNLSLLWLSGGLKQVWNGRRPLWSGYMQTVCDGEHAPTSVVRMLPILDINPSDLSCVYSTLNFICQQAKFLMLPTPSVTFDQPLYIKAVDIVHQEDLNLVVRLGGFHTLMNFMGAIGDMMKGSGLEEAFELLYGRKTIEHVMSGKAYVRAVRGHMIIYSAVKSLLLNQLIGDAGCHDEVTQTVVMESTVDHLVLDNSDINSLHTLYKDVLDHKVSFTPASNVTDTSSTYIMADDIAAHDSLNKLKINYDELCKILSEQSRTAHLWILYLHYIDILQDFLLAERTSNWLSHLNTMKAMLNLFAAAHHVNYAKSARVYLQQMCELENTHPWLYQQFIGGMHTVRKSDRFWAGLSTDLIIEQDMMAAVKSRGGLTHGRGMSETTRIMWLNTLTECAAVGASMRKLAGDQRSQLEHVEVTRSRLLKDCRDLEKMQCHFHTNSPFRFVDNARIVSLSTGVSADAADQVTCDRADEIGLAIMKKWDNGEYSKLSLLKADKIKTLSDVSHVYKFADSDNDIDASKLFQRLVIVAHSDRQFDIESAFQYELTIYPTSLFRDGMMRKPDKPNLLKARLVGYTDAKHSSDVMYVIDGGYLLHKVRWFKNQTVQQVLHQYSSFLLKRFGQNVYVVFDGYSNEPSTKDHEHARRSARVSRVAPNISMDLNTVVSFDQDSILANSTNKGSLISLLSDHLHAYSVSVKTAVGDADVDIAATALDLAASNKQDVVVFAEDTDILVLLLHHKSPMSANIFFEYDLKAQSALNCKCINIGQFQKILGHVCQYLLVLHAFGGCDTTSAIYCHGKGSLLTTLSQNCHLECHLETLQQYDATVSEVQMAGTAVMTVLFNGALDQQLSKLRYNAYCKMAAAKGSFVADRLPPTEDATQLHSKRVHLQAVHWKSLGARSLIATEWGWQLAGATLKPIPMTQQPGPPDLMKVIRCNCSSACKTMHCSCRKNHLKCIAACGQCHGVECDNAETTMDYDSDSEVDDNNNINDSILDASNPDELGTEFFFDSDLYPQFVDEEVV